MTKDEIEARESIDIVKTCNAKKNYIKEKLEMYGLNTTLQEILDMLDEQITKYDKIVSDIFNKKQ